MDDNKKESKIDEMKDLLYSRKTGEIKEKRSILKRIKKKDLRRAWGEESSFNREKENDYYKYETKRKNFVFYIILFFSLLFCVASLAFTFFYLSFNKNEISLDKLNISILGPNSVKSGESLPFSVIIENPSDIEYQNVELNMYYPNSTIKTESKDFVKNETIEFKKNILPGGKVIKKFDVILSGSTGEKKDINIDLFFKGKNYSGVLNKKFKYTVEISSSPVDIELNYPKKIVSGDEFQLDVDVLSNVTETLNNLLVVGRYPVGFEVTDTKPKYILSDTTKNIFKIKELKPGEKKRIKIRGYLKGQMDESKFFSFVIGDTVPFRNEIRTIFSRIEDKTIIKKPDLTLNLKTINDDGLEISNYKAGDEVDIQMKLQNNLSESLTGVKIISDIEGSNLFDKSKLKVKKGFYNSNRDRIIWGGETNKSFKMLKNNEFISDEINFNINDIKTIAGYVKDPKIDFNFKVYANNFSDSDSKTDVFSEFKKEIRIGTNVYFKEEVLHSDGVFKNKGPITPKVGIPTTYTVVWKLYNTSSDISDVKISAKLPIYVKYLNNTSPKKSYFSYNPETREVSLNYKKVKAFIGYRTDPKTASFQIEYTPVSTHVGSNPVIIGKKSIVGFDDYIQKDINFEVPESTTDIKFDSQYKYNIGVVDD